MKHPRFALAALAGMLVFAAQPASAQLCTFTGSGASGTDCFGQGWVLDNGGWGIPGILHGIIPFAGNLAATDFHITFFASGSFDGLIGFGDGESTFPFDTRLKNSATGDFWDVTGSGNTINFTAPAGTQLDPGQNFFANVQFLNGLPTNLDDVSFEASWTNGGLSSVPEPASMSLLAMGLVGIAGAARRRKHRG